MPNGISNENPKLFFNMQEYCRVNSGVYELNNLGTIGPELYFTFGAKLIPEYNENPSE